MVNTINEPTTKINVTIWVIIGAGALVAFIIITRLPTNEKQKITTNEGGRCYNEIKKCLHKALTSIDKSKDRRMERLWGGSTTNRVNQYDKGKIKRVANRISDRLITLAVDYQSKITKEEYSQLMMLKNLAVEICQVSNEYDDNDLNQAVKKFKKYTKKFIKQLEEQT